MKSKSKKPTPSCAGFGLVELLVSISIMLIVMAVILVRHSSFNGAVLLRNQAYEIALDTREVQVSAVSAMGSGSGTNFRTALGIHFDSTGTNDNTYRIFRDTSNDHYYQSSEEFGKQNMLDGRFEIREIRSVSGATETVQNNISVVFERPNYDARFFTSSGVAIAASRVEIDISKRGYLGTTADVVRTLEITSTGQIAVQ